MPRSTSSGNSNVSGLLRTPAASPAGWQNLEIVDKDGNPPTHANQRWYDKKTGRVVQKDLRHVIERGMWPTPRASPNENRQTKPTPSQQAGKHGMNLSTAVNITPPDQMFPTPTVNGNYNRAGLSAKSGDGLATAVAKQAEQETWPGPSGNELGRTVNQRAKGSPNPIRGPLNPTWVEGLMGFPPGWTILGFLR